MISYLCSSVGQMAFRAASPLSTRSSRFFSDACCGPRLEVTLHDHNIAEMMICNAKSLNALDRSILKSMHDELQRLTLEGRISVLILTGEGDQSFIAGANVKEIHESSIPELKKCIRLGQEVTNLFENAYFPVIGMVRGICWGGGLEEEESCFLDSFNTEERLVKTSAFVNK